MLHAELSVGLFSIENFLKSNGGGEGDIVDSSEALARTDSLTSNTADKDGDGEVNDLKTASSSLSALCGLNGTFLSHRQPYTMCLLYRC